MRQSDIEEKLGAPTHRVRTWLAKLEPLRAKVRHERSATRYSFPEVLFLAVVKLLEEAGVRAESLAPISSQLFELICRREPVGKDDVLILWRAASGWQFKGKPDPCCVQVHVPMAMARAMVAPAEEVALLAIQGEIGLGVVSVRPPTRAGAR